MSITRGTKVYFLVNNNIREGVVESVNYPFGIYPRPEPSSYCIRYRGGQWTRPAEEVVAITD